MLSTADLQKVQKEAFLTTFHKPDTGEGVTAEEDLNSFVRGEERQNLHNLAWTQSPAHHIWLFSTWFHPRALKVYLRRYKELPQLRSEVHVIYGSHNQDCRRQLLQANWLIRKYSRFSENNTFSVCTAETGKPQCKFIYSSWNCKTTRKSCFSQDSCQPYLACWVKPNKVFLKN